MYKEINKQTKKETNKQRDHINGKKGTHRQTSMQKEGSSFSSVTQHAGSLTTISFKIDIRAYFQTDTDKKKRQTNRYGTTT